MEGIYYCLLWTAQQSTTSKPANNDIIETTTPLCIVYIIVTLPLQFLTFLSC